MARGATSRLSSLSPVDSAVSMLFWGLVKMALSVVMLVLAARVVPGLSLAGAADALVLCMRSYWFALLWRVPAPDESLRTSNAERTRETWPPKSMPRPPVNTSFTT